MNWISIEEELPQYDNIPVLFWVENGTYDNKAGCYVGNYSNRIYDGKKGRWFDIYGTAIYADVTHWAYLPKGPTNKFMVGLEVRDYER